MNKLLKYKDGSVYINSDRLSITPVGIVPIEEIDLGKKTEVEISELRKSPKDSYKLLKKEISKTGNV